MSVTRVGTYDFNVVVDILWPDSMGITLAYSLYYCIYNHMMFFIGSYIIRTFIYSLLLIEEEEAMVRAVLEREKNELEVEMNVLHKEKDIAVAEAELQAYSESSHSGSRSSISVPVENMKTRTEQSVVDQIKHNESGEELDQYPMSPYR